MANGQQRTIGIGAQLDHAVHRDDRGWGHYQRHDRKQHHTAADAD